jgi:hypothetical protein
LNVEALIDTYLPKRTGWSLDIHEALPHGIEGYTDPKSKTLNLPEETYQRLGEDDGRARFTGCHEFAHVVLHGDQMAERMVSLSQQTEYMFRSDSSSLRAFEDPEWQANYLAGALLMPRKALVLLKRRLGRGLLPSDLVSEFKVSSYAAEVRLRKLGGAI